jgi:organic radical activating enzyme
MPEDVEMVGFENFLIQPMDGFLKQKNTLLAIDFCQKNPEWSLSIQTHKLLEIR